MGFLSKIKGAVKSAARAVCSKTMLFLGVSLAGAAAFAEDTATTYSPVAKEAGGNITFTPTNIINPIVDGVISSYSAWAILVVIIIAVGLMVWIFKKK